MGSFYIFVCMNTEKDFFSFKNTVQTITETDSEQLANYLQVIDAFARTTYKSVYVIDYQKQSFEYVSNNPLFLCGKTAEEVKALGYTFYFENVVEEDLELLLKINQVGFDLYDQVPLEDRKHYTIAYDFRLKNDSGSSILINQKLTPIFITEEGKVWKALCIVSLAENNTSGNIKVYKTNSNDIKTYCLIDDCWKTEEKPKLTEREKQILQLSAQGYKVNEISEKLFISADTVKFHRRKLFDKIQVSSISEAIFYATSNKLI